MISANRTTVLCVIFTVALFAPQLSADSVPVNWIGPTGMGGDGNWSTASDWSGGVVPNNGGGTTYGVTITGATTVSTPFSDVSVDISPTVDSVNLGCHDQNVGGGVSHAPLRGVAQKSRCFVERLTRFRQWLAKLQSMGQCWPDLEAAIHSGGAGASGEAPWTVSQ
jgi:hypothetical protein